MKAEELDALIERVEKATGPDRETDGLIALSEGWTNLKMPGDRDAYWRKPGVTQGWNRTADGPPPYTASIDSALALMERVLPGIWYVMAKGRLTESEPLFACELLFGEVQQSIADGPTPSLAIILATLRALRSIRGGKP